MNMNQDKKAQLIITYPGRIGFTFVAHQLLEKMSHHFALPGLFEEDPDDCFSVILNGKQIYTCHPKDPAALNKETIFHAIRNHLPQGHPVHERPTTADQDHCQFPDCFCSGE